MDTIPLLASVALGARSCNFCIHGNRLGSSVLEKNLPTFRWFLESQCRWEFTSVNWLLCFISLNIVTLKSPQNYSYTTRIRHPSPSYRMTTIKAPHTYLPTSVADVRNLKHVHTSYAKVVDLFDRHLKQVTPYCH